MLEFNRFEVKILTRCVTAFAEAFRNEVADPVSARFRGFRPPEVVDVIEQLVILERQLGIDVTPLRVHEAHARILRRILFEARRRMAESIEEPMQSAVDPQLVRHLRKELRPLEELMSASWFAETEPQRIPMLTDYVSIRHAEEMAGDGAPLAPREYDEKFHILEAPRLFLGDLAHYRRKCRLRNASIAVAFVDIDDFKALNTRFGETRVDIDILPRFMEAVEAHVFAHGHAYRFGGDEYVLTLPNMERAWAESFLHSLEERVTRTKYASVDVVTTVSIGLCAVEPDCHLTDREVLARANDAKQYAKANGKACVAAFDGFLYRPEDLAIRRPPPIPAPRADRISTG
jgi:diguanylate cyclase (GGDEF)-like protein